MFSKLKRVLKHTAGEGGEGNNTPAGHLGSGSGDGSSSSSSNEARGGDGSGLNAGPKSITSGPPRSPRPFVKSSGSGNFLNDSYTLPQEDDGEDDGLASDDEDNRDYYSVINRGAGSFWTIDNETDECDFGEKDEDSDEHEDKNEDGKDGDDNSDDDSEQHRKKRASTSPRKPEDKDHEGLDDDEEEIEEKSRREEEEEGKPHSIKHESTTAEVHNNEQLHKKKRLQQQQQLGDGTSAGVEGTAGGPTPTNSMISIKRELKTNELYKQLSSREKRLFQYIQLSRTAAMSSSGSESESTIVDGGTRLDLENELRNLRWSFMCIFFLP